MPRSNFSINGLAIGENDANMTYLYGVSDFFHVMFEDTSKVNLLLEADSEVAAQVYSKFLQMTSTISLEDIQKTLGQTLTLVTIKSTDKVAGELNTYKLPTSILESRYIANRPLLPTTLLEQTVDYRIERSSTGDLQIRFAKDISDAGFSTRLLSDQTTKEFALWFVDTEIDEGWIGTHYASLIGVDPATSSEAYKNFIYGLYYIYVQGPTLEMLRKGLNLCLGVPLARDEETVLEIRKYLETDQYIVITDENQYLIPYGLSPSVVEGDVLSVGDELAQWVEVKDYINDGEWWINLMIPPTIIAETPAGQINRYASRGSHFDYLMRQYLKKHTFLVNVKVQDFKNNQVFTQLSDIIKRAKPAYTQAVYIWTIPNLEEEMTISEEMFVQRRDQARCDNLTYAIEKFYRSNEDAPLKRGCPTFMRTNVPYWVDKSLGTNSYINAKPTEFNGGVLDGFINPNAQYRGNTEMEKGWIRAILDRGSEINGPSRSKLGFFRKAVTIPEASTGYQGLAVHPVYGQAKISKSLRIIPLYLTTQADLAKKCDQSLIETPNISEWIFDIMNPANLSEEINSLAINEGVPNNAVSQLVTYFNIWRERGSDVHYLSNIIPDLGLQSYKIPSVSEITPNDYLLGMRVQDKVVGIYWVTFNRTLQVKPYIPVEENDQLTMSFTAPPSRGMGPTSSPYYLTRGRGTLDYNNVITELNGAPINDPGTTATSGLVSIYSDNLNITREMLRDGTPLVHMMEIK